MGLTKKGTVEQRPKDTMRESTPWRCLREEAEGQARAISLRLAQGQEEEKGDATCGLMTSAVPK